LTAAALSVAMAVDEVFDKTGWLMIRSILLIRTESSSDLVHIGVAHGRGVCGRYMSFVLRGLCCERHAGRSCDQRKRKHIFPHESILPEPASPSRHIIFNDKSQSGQA